MFWTFGALTEAALAWVVLENQDWHYFLAYSSIPLFLILFFFPCLPESPRYYLISNQHDKAVKSLQRLCRENHCDMPSGQLMRVKQQKPGKISDLFSPALKRTTILVWIIWYVGCRQLVCERNEMCEIYAYIHVRESAQHVLSAVMLASHSEYAISGI